MIITTVIIFKNIINERKNKYTLEYSSVLGLAHERLRHSHIYTPNPIIAAFDGNLKCFFLIMMKQ